MRSLDFATFTKEEGTTSLDSESSGKNASHHHTLQDGDLLLASGSQDKYIRLWRIAAVDDTPPSQAEAASAGSDPTLTQDMLKSLEEM